MFEVKTSNDFSKQALLVHEADEVKEHMIIYEPDTSLEDIAIKEFQSLKKSPLAVSYDKTFALVPPRKSMYPLTTLYDYALARTVADDAENIQEHPRRILSYETSFPGVYLARNRAARSIMFFHRRKLNSRSAMNMYSFNFGINAKDRVKKTNSNCLSLKNNGLKILFAYSNIEKARDRRKIDWFVNKPMMLIPEVDKIRFNPFMIIAQLAKIWGARVYFAHSSLAKPLIDEIVEKTKPCLYYTPFKLEKRLVRETLNGPEIVKLTGKQALALEKYGLEDHGRFEVARWGHSICVSKFEWR
ncbi:hypothetical protein D6825_00025 [Candidatus Woesearchaeota archaeon]|nr:MAG: hypothetical protein D6825_00025 [Candidatus Woesearchaeota archaeon]